MEASQEVRLKEAEAADKKSTANRDTFAEPTDVLSSRGSTKSRANATRSRSTTRFSALRSPSQHGAARGDPHCETSIARPYELTRRTSARHLELDRSRTAALARAVRRVPCFFAAFVAFPRLAAAFPFHGGAFRTCFDSFPKSVSFAERWANMVERGVCFTRQAQKSCTAVRMHSSA